MNVPYIDLYALELLLQFITHYVTSFIGLWWGFKIDIFISVQNYCHQYKI